MKTILITGCSSGFGQEIASHFLARGWKVVATMRVPDEDALPRSEHLRILPLDVTNAASIRAAVEQAGPIDALVNNAGIGFLNSLEGTPLEKIREIFETNTFGTMAVTQAVIPQFRERRAGVIVNVTSTVTLRPLLLLSIYTASKAAVNAFTRSLALELQPFGIRATLVLPGYAPGTRFGENARAQMLGIPDEYAGMAQKIFTAWEESTDPVTHATDVAEAVWTSVTDPGAPAFLPAGADAIAWAAARTPGQL
ncbi:SDR family oxidoreductase [Luteolibacter yonseiensis]|uniref:SDR family oxidoreductase n=1 Tax=Luteolibacter yonseiensis TaxID=1144680 RepID=A0A934R2I0_9BACT|nr:SDR family oxidoreductase [Luteolibacter yonseiensis]MBK1815086.1 SDR family oxidoreductase [Luteolibacter yonseiensis]